MPPRPPLTSSGLPERVPNLPPPWNVLSGLDLAHRFGFVDLVEFRKCKVQPENARARQKGILADGARSLGVTKHPLKPLIRIQDVA